MSLQAAETYNGRFLTYGGRAMLIDSSIVHELLQKLGEFELTPWKTVGLLGSVVFASRWFVQMYYTRKLKRVVMPVAFWLLSVFGSCLMLAYFIVGKNDSVGIISTLFPAFVSVYNLSVHLRQRDKVVTVDDK